MLTDTYSLVIEKIDLPNVYRVGSVCSYQVFASYFFQKGSKRKSECVVSGSQMNNNVIIVGRNKCDVVQADLNKCILLFDENKVY